MAEELVCYRCGGSLAALPLPLGRLEECPACTIQLHVCRMCIFFDPNVAKQCREDDAEEVKEKERANFCDYFKPSPAAFDPKFGAAEAKAAGELAALFDEGETKLQADDDDSLSDAEKLFR